MARPWSRRPKDEPPEGEPGEDGDGTVHLDAEDHAWWAQGEVRQAWAPKPPRAPDEPPERDILAEHFGEDWRTSFGLNPPSREEQAAAKAREQQAIDDEDPYKVLGVEPSATWEEIVAAHRAMARAHHPDLLTDQSEDARAAGEDRIRVINRAYQELRVRRGR